jgi:hypothetical protein
MAGFSGVSRYLGDREHERLVRLSVWQELGSERFRAEAAISVDEAEAGRLASFLRESEPPRRKRRGEPLASAVGERYSETVESKELLNR